VVEPDDAPEYDDDSEDDEFVPDGTGGVIPFKNQPALWSYYLGVFSLIPCFPIGVAAFVLGLRGLRAVRAEPRVRGTIHAWVGIRVGGFFGLVWLAGTLFAVGSAFVR
jgi:hypothetical protein